MTIYEHFEINMTIKNIAIILASGTGTRFGAERPKQLIKLAGKTVLEHTIDCFESHIKINEILIVVSNEQKELIQHIVLQAGYKKISKIVIGGETRQESSYAGINAIDGDEHKVLVHDAVRPLLDHSTIDRCLDALNNNLCVDTVVAASDTIVKADKDNYIETIPKRAELRMGQTPQGFISGLLRKAHNLASINKNIEVTDDCGLVLNFNLAQVKLVEGNVSNIKITHPLDIYLADRLFQLRTSQISKKNLTLMKNKVLVIFGASRGIGKDIAKLAEQNGAFVLGFSRSTHIDIAKRDDVRLALENAYQKYGKIDFVINTAGVLRTGLLISQTENDIDEQLNINLKGSINVVQESFKYLKDHGGAIILFTSSSYTRGRAFSSVYSATKAAIVNLVQGISQEYKPHNININAINPERTATPMRVENFGKEPEDSLLSSEYVAEMTIASLLNDITGEVIDVRL